MPSVTDTPFETVQELPTDAPGAVHPPELGIHITALDTPAGIPHARGRRDSTYSAIEAVVDGTFEQEDDFRESDSDDEERQYYGDDENEDDNKSPTVCTLDYMSPIPHDWMFIFLNRCLVRL